MDGETTVVVTGANDAPESETTEWESVSSEITSALESGFSNLRESFHSELATLRQSNSDLLAANTQLSQQVTQMAQTVMERLPALTQQPSPVVVVETPAENLPNEEAESPVVETNQVETEQPTRRKRRTL